MEVTRQALRTLGITFSTRFQNAFNAAPSQAALAAMDVTSTSTSQEYGWLGEVPNVREWLGDRVVNNLERFAYTIKNKDWELTIGVKKTDIEDDNLGVYSPRIDMMGRSTKRHKDMIVYQALKDGFATDCYDGQSFFDTEHPLLDKDGNASSFANTDGGGGTPWFLVAKNQPIMPIVFQNRQDWNFVSRAAPNDDNVFWQKEFVYGSDARYNVGYGLPQMCWGSKQTLDAAHYATARQALLGMATDYGQKLALNEFALLVPSTMEGAALQILNADRNADGAANIYYKTADLNVVPWLD